MLKLIKNLYEISGKYSKKITAMLVFDFIKSIFEIMSMGAIFLSLMLILQNTFEARPLVLNDIYKVFGLALVSLLGKIIFSYLADRNKYIFSYSLGEENRLKIGNRLKNVHMGYFSENSLGEISGGLSTVIGELETTGIFIIEQFLVGAMQTLAMVIFIIPYDLFTGIIIFITLIIGLIQLQLGQKKEDQLTGKLLTYKLDLNSKILEFVKGIWISKAFGKGDNTVKELNESIDQNKKGFLDVEKTLTVSQFTFSIILRLGTAAIILASIVRFLNGSIDQVKAIILIVSSFVVFSGYELAGSMQSIRGVAVQNLETLIGLRNLPVIDQGEEREVGGATIEMDEISFSYDERKKLFEDLSLNIPEGKTTALVGFSGSGKTSLCNLMARFWDVEKGEVLMGGKNVKNYDYSALLSNFTFVFQDVYLFDDTIKNNIKFAKADASDEEIIEIAKKAQCHDFIMKLPQGYDTVVGEGGAKLSGGERQRISIARGLLKPSKFVILDEATSSIDPENERELLLALKELLKGKTTIIIAHKLSTVKNADQIVVLNKGKIEQIGRHEDLMKEEGTYKKFIAIREKAMNWALEE